MQDAKNRIDMTAVAAAIAADIAVRFGHTVDAVPQDVRESTRGAGCTLQIEQTLGIFAMIIKTAAVNLRAEPTDDGRIWVLASLDYEHMGGGTNGYNIGTYWLRDGVIESFHAR